MQQLKVIPRSRLCEELGVSRSTIKRWIESRNFPKSLPSSGREPLFDLEQVEDWLKIGGASHD